MVGILAKLVSHGSRGTKKVWPSLSTRAANSAFRCTGVASPGSWKLRVKRLYARGGVRDYWIVNLVDRALEVYRDPAPDPAAPYGRRYRTVEWLGPAAAVSPLALPAVHIAASELLP